MTDILAWVVASVTTAPIFLFIMTFYITNKMTDNKKKSLQFASDLSTIFFILSVHFLIMTIWEKNVIWIILTALVLVAMVFLYLQWKMNDEVKISKVLKGFWRFSFLVFGLSHFGLMIFGLIYRMIHL